MLRFSFPVLLFLLSFFSSAYSHANDDFELPLDELAINRTVNPCDDFYQFACGNWIKSASQPRDESRWFRSFSTIEQQNYMILRDILDGYAFGDSSIPSRNSKKLGDFYASCMNADSIEADAKMGLPLLIEDIDKAKVKNISKLVGRLQLDGVDILFNIKADPDWKNPTKMAAAINPGGMGLPSRDYYLEETPEKKTIQNEYKKHISNVLMLAGESRVSSQVHASQIFSFEQELARNSLSPEARRDPEKLYNAVTLNDLESWTTSLWWDDIFTEMGMRNTTQLIVSEPNFMQGMGRLVAKTPPNQLKTYLKWQALRAFSPALGKRFSNEHFLFYDGILAGQKIQKPHWKQCVIATDAMLGSALGEAFVNRSFSEESKFKASQLLDNIRNAFEKNLLQLDWMDDKTRRAALLKFDHVREKIGFPDTWTNLSDLEIRRDFYLGNLVKINRFRKLRELAKVGKPVDPGYWDMNPQTVNAYYAPERNEIVFPAGILQSPFFSLSSPGSANYGAIGAVMGHELTHGFDDEGSRYNPVGRLENWWSPEISEIFAKKTECLVNQYSRYKADGKFPVNGKLTLGENIADLGGLKSAYEAYVADRFDGLGASETLDGFTGEQQFFLAYAQAWCAKTTLQVDELRVATDPHSPAQFRVNGVLANTPEFAKAFGCTAPSVMNPSLRCSVW